MEKEITYREFLNWMEACDGKLKKSLLKSKPSTEWVMAHVGKAGISESQNLGNPEIHFFATVVGNIVTQVEVKIPNEKNPFVFVAKGI